MVGQRALVLGGTGMLTRCTSALVADGWQVVVPSRRYVPISAEPTSTAIGRVRWVEADWTDPDDTAHRAAKALGGQADLLVAWVHGYSREPILRSVAPLLAPDAPVVEIHGSSSADPLTGCPEPVITDHPTQQVVLRAVSDRGFSRWLTQDEIADSVLDAIRRGLAGRVSGIHQIGGVRVG
jgi:hypothetical protein